MTLHLTTVAAVLCLAAGPALAQTANTSPSAGSGAGAGNATRAAPSGGTARPNAGVPQTGPETQVETNAEDRSKKDTTICKGC